MVLFLFCFPFPALSQGFGCSGPCALGLFRDCNGYTHCMRRVVILTFCCVSSLFDIGLVGFLRVHPVQNGECGVRWSFLCLVLSCLVL